MNSLNILSSRVIGQAAPASPRRRSHSQDDGRQPPQRDVPVRGRTFSDYRRAGFGDEEHRAEVAENPDLNQADPVDDMDEDAADEKTALLPQPEPFDDIAYKNRWHQALKRIIAALAEGARILLSYIGAPAMYMVACFEDGDGTYSAFMPVKRMAHYVKGSKVAAEPHTDELIEDFTPSQSEKPVSRGSDRKLRSSVSKESLPSSVASDSENEKRQQGEERMTRSKTNRLSASEEPEPSRPSIRIKLNSNPSLVDRRAQRTAKAELANASAPPEGQLTVDNIKSPTSPSSLHKITKYPHAPAPPRPLIPRRQPSYTSTPAPNLRRAAMLRTPPHLQQKTLILDLDETLIHSLAKGGRMSSGHMVEVKLNAPVGVPGSGIIGPQHPILYYVHKRPHCDDFLRKVCKWYKLVIFTASVPEYADPVIDWLEQERKFFSARYYRQHCTFRNGAYIKDLSSVEPDLSRVCILDNSPMSYIFHEGMFHFPPGSISDCVLPTHYGQKTWTRRLIDILSCPIDNAIPIEGWINDPTDNGLLHLIPLLEALQYVTDVRAFLGLRKGEAEA